MNNNNNNICFYKNSFKYSIIIIIIICFTNKSISYEPITIKLQDNQYIEIITGNPGKYNKYRIDYNLNKTYIYSTPNTYSQSYNENGELFYFNIYKIRLPVIYGVPYNDISLMLSKVNHHGIIGLGSSSEIWKYWNKITLSATDIVFGEFDPYLTDLSYNSIIIDNNFIKDYKGINCIVNNKEYLLKFDESSDISYLPTDLYIEQNFIIEIDYNYDDCMKKCQAMGIYNYHYNLMCKNDNKNIYIKISNNDYNIFTKFRSFYQMIETNKENYNQIILGRTYTDKMVIFIDKINNNKLIKPSFNKYEYNNNKDINLYLSFGLALIFVIWLLTINSQLADVERNRKFFILLQIYGEILVISSLIYNVFGINCIRFYNHYFHNNQNYLFYIFIIFIVIMLILNTIILIKTFRFSRNPFESLIIDKYNHPILTRWKSFQLIKRSIFETIMLFTLWITLLESHGYIQGYIYLISISTILPVIHLVYSLLIYISYNDENCHINNKNILISSSLSIFNIFMITISLFFLIYCNLMVYLNICCYNHPYYYSLIILYITSFVLIPTLFIFIHFERAICIYRVKVIEHICCNNNKIN
jgi:hypothetical protein